MSVRDVCWPRAQALLTGNNPDLDYWSCWSIFSLMGVMGGNRPGPGQGGLPSSSHATGVPSTPAVSTRFPSDQSGARVVRPGRAWLGAVASRLASPSWQRRGEGDLTGGFQEELQPNIRAGGGMNRGNSSPRHTLITGDNQAYCGWWCWSCDDHLDSFVVKDTRQWCSDQSDGNQEENHLRHLRPTSQLNYNSQPGWRTEIYGDSHPLPHHHHH